MRRAAGCLRAASLGAVIGVGACASPPPPDPAANAKPAGAQATAKPVPGCQVREHLGMVRPGDNIPINMHVQNSDRWCFSSLGFSGQSALGSRLVDDAVHGEVRLLVRSGGIAFGYRPRPAYAGADSFLISMPGGNGNDYNLAVTVAVSPPP